ncbi:MAG: hypothetical protein L0L82_10385, partial [Tetragenococcus koreensis]|nr:hypothetical protein [Tetragenococcus koreensis]
MENNIIKQVKEAKKFMENTANFPLTYCLFLGTCFLLWKPKYISLIKISRWVPNSLQKIILELFTLIYSNIIWIVFLLISCILIIYLLSKYTSFFYIL